MNGGSTPLVEIQQDATPLVRRSDAIRSRDLTGLGLDWEIRDGEEGFGGLICTIKFGS